MQLPKVAFAPPPDEALVGRPVQVPVVVGRPVDEARRILEGAGFRVAVSPTSEFSQYPKGSVARTDPSGGATVSKGSLIMIHVSGGPAPPTTPPPPGGGNGCPPRATTCPPD